MHIENSPRETRRVNANPNATARLKRLSASGSQLRLQSRRVARAEPAASEMVRLAAVK